MKIIRKDLLYRYSPYSVDRKINKELIIADKIQQLQKVEKFIFESEVIIYFSYNTWESDFFNCNSIILHFVDFKQYDKIKIYKALIDFKNNIQKKYLKYVITIEIPSEDNFFIQCLNDLRYRTLETRLHYYNNDLKNFAFKRFQTRTALQEDIPNLKKIASFMRNPFDRFHSDWTYSTSIADKYLETYIENAINGFSDIILVPDGEKTEPDSFLTADLYQNDWDKLNYKISKMVLSAVSSETNKGWYVKLISEMTYKLMEYGVESIFMNTQSTNFAVLSTWEKLGYKIGRATHLLSFSNYD